jgi:hypothetical protein
MAIHTDFWVVVGTAAPVIALANLVAIGDGWGLREAFSHWAKPQTEVQRNWVRQGIRAGIRVYLIGTGNLVVQAFIIAAALTSLESGKDKFPTALAVPVESLGIVACLLSAVMTARWRAIVQHVQYDTRRAQRTDNE